MARPRQRLVEVGYPRAVELEPVRTTLHGAGFEGAVVQHFGTAHDVLIRIAPRDDVDRSELSNQAFDALRIRDSAVRRSDWRSAIRHFRPATCASDVKSDYATLIDLPSGHREMALGVAPVAELTPPSPKTYYQKKSASGGVG